MISRNVIPPKWIVELPPGEYDVKELAEISGLAKISIYATIKKYGAIVKKVDSGYRNLIKNVYVWEGYKKNEK